MKVAVKQFQLAGHPWLSLFIVMLSIPIAQLLVGVVVIGLFKCPRDAPTTQFIVALLAYVLVLFVLVPFVLELPEGTRSFSAYLDAIRLNRIKLFLRLLLLGLSCYLILALCQVSGVLVYRMLEGKAVTWTFVRSILDVSGDLPPKSSSLLVSFPTIFEEIAFRGVILSLFLAHYPKPAAIVIAALSFGAIHVLNLATGRELAWVLGQAIWAAILGVFYGVAVLKSGSLWPAMMVHYLSNLFVGSLTSYLQTSASIQTQAIYGVVFSYGLVPTTLMILWALLFTTLWPIAG